MSKIQIENENLFFHSISQGFNIFCGAGFSVLSKDKEEKKLPLGFEMLDELKGLFDSQIPAISTYQKLDRACTKIQLTDKASFYQYINNRFNVSYVDPLYYNLKNLPIKCIYTMNVDNLWFKILERNGIKRYINDASLRGTTYKDKHAINYYPLHGCVNHKDNNYVFGNIDIAREFLNKDKTLSWRSLNAHITEPILFWGWNFNDMDSIQAMYEDEKKINNNIAKWFLVFSKNGDESGVSDTDKENIDFLRTLKFNIIFGDTKSLLEKIGDFIKKDAYRSNDEKQEKDGFTQEFREKYMMPEKNKVASYPFESFFLDYIPRWSYIFNRQVCPTSNYTKIAEKVAAKKNLLVYGLRGCGKTTIMMQLLADTNVGNGNAKTVLYCPSVMQAKLFLKELDGRKTLLFVDDCLSDVDAIIEFLKCPNIQIVGFDRDFNFESQYHKLKNLNIYPLDITYLDDTDAQPILNTIPAKLCRKETTTKNFFKDKTLPTLLATNLKGVNFHFLNDFYSKNKIAAEIFLMVCYVHSCGVPCSFDMIYSYLGDENYDWQEMYDTIKNSGALLKDWCDELGAFDEEMAIEDYYGCRSRYFAEKILKSIQPGNELFKQVFLHFLQSVPVCKIHNYNKFRKAGYDSDLALKAFADVLEGERYYEDAAYKDDNEYIYQQAALYFSRKKKFQKAFEWIDKAKNLSSYNRFSIQSTHSQIYFDANIDIDKNESRMALERLAECCKSDKRRSIHFIAFVERFFSYARTYGIETEEEKVLKNTAEECIAEGLDEQNHSLSLSHKFRLNDFKNIWGSI